MFRGLTCVESASDSAFCSLFDSWPAACEYEASEQHEPSFEPAPDCVWSTSWSVLLPFAEAATAADAFVWVTSPSSPGLRIRIGTLMFDGAFWVESASDSAFCSFFASCPAAWSYEASEQHEPSLEPPPDCVWSTSWSVLFSFAEAAAAADAFVCVTSPPSPLLPIRIGTFTFDGFTWVESASDLAFCSLSAACPAACPYEPPAPPDCVWSALWSVLFSFAEIAAAADAFVCVTSPPSPLLPIRVGTD